MIHKAGTCGCPGTLNACLLMLENPTLSYFCLLLAAGSNGLSLVAPRSGSVCFFSPSPFSTALAQKWQSQVTEQSCLQLSVANRVYVMYWTSSTRKKKKKHKKQSHFSKQSKHAAHDWLHLMQEKIYPSSRPSALIEAPTSLSAQGHQTALGLTSFLLTPHSVCHLSQA